MIHKPNRQERRAFWKADAWQAASSEPMFRWVGADSRFPRLAALAAIALLTVMGLVVLKIQGLGGLLVMVVILTTWLFSGQMLRRVLMYWSIRRYGVWKSMPREMREVLASPSDLAEAPAKFAPLPRGYEPLVPGLATPQHAKRRWYETAALLLVAPFVPMVSMLGVTTVAEHPAMTGLLAALAGAGYVCHRQSKDRQANIPS